MTFANANPILGGTGVLNMATTGTTGAFNVNATGLQPGQTYAYAAYATNLGGTTYTAVSTFNTLAALGTTALLEGPAAGSDADIVASASAWTATSNASWLHTTAAGSGTGLATFTFDADTGATRTGTLTIAGLTLTVTQAGNTYVATHPFPTLATGLNNPAGIAVDSSGNVYVADEGNNAIEEWNANTQHFSTLVTGLNAPASYDAGTQRAISTLWSRGRRYRECFHCRYR